MKIVAVIQARLGSKRFPRKSLSNYNGESLVRHVTRRVKQVHSVDKVVAAVPLKDDLSLRDEFIDSGADDVVFGSENDVLQRFWHAAALHKASLVVRVTADCPVWSPEACEGTIQSFLTDKQNRQFWSNDTLVSGWPDGTDVEVFSIDLLNQTRLAQDLTDFDREHVTPWMIRNVKCGTYKREFDKWSETKLSIDTPEDLLNLQSLDIPVEWLWNTKT
jgi:spore coat polysaccharide biosynthesis protein SpsF (cytidylyltransferase family)